jgi:tripartite ATP-independent transporter DctP family solute receptor
MTRRNLLLTVSLITIFAAFSSIAVAQDIQERTIRFGHTVSPGHPIALGAKRFGEIVTAKSGGKIKFRDFPASQLGPEAQQQSALVGGTQQMMAQGSAQLAGAVKEFGLLDFPFIVATEQQADALHDGPAGRALLDMLPAKGLIGLGYWENGFRHVTNSKRPITTLEDLAGLKIRVQPSPIFIDLFRTLNTNPVPMAYSELYTALETGAVDAQENPLLNIRASKLYEVQKYASLTSHVYGNVAIIVSKKFWDSLSPTEQSIIQDAFLEARDYERQESRRQTREAVAELKAKGMQVNEVAPAELERMRLLTQPVADRFAAEYDPKVVGVFNSELKRIKTP